MGRPRKEREPLPPIWRVPDELWAEVEPIIAELDPPNRVGPKRVSARPILDAIIYRGRTGGQWNRLPQEYPDDSTVHRAFRRWKGAGVFRRRIVRLQTEGPRGQEVAHYGLVDNSDSGSVRSCLDAEAKDAD